VREEGRSEDERTKSGREREVTPKKRRTKEVQPDGRGRTMDQVFQEIQRKETDRERAREREREMQAWEPGDWNNNNFHLKLVSFFTNFSLNNSVMQYEELLGNTT